MSLKGDRAYELFKEGYNCSETLTLAGNEAYNLGLDANASKLMAGFGGGCGCGHSGHGGGKSCGC